MPQVSSLPYFCLGFYWIHLYPSTHYGHLCSDTIVLLSSGLLQKPLIDPSASPCSHPFLLHVTSSILHFHPRLKSSVLFQVPWGLSPSFLAWYIRLSMIWFLLTSCYWGRIILLWDCFIKMDLDSSWHISQRSVMKNTGKSKELYSETHIHTTWMLHLTFYKNCICFIACLFTHSFLSSCKNLTLFLVQFKISSGHQYFSFLKRQHAYHMTVKHVFVPNPLPPRWLCSKHR